MFLETNNNIVIDFNIILLYFLSLVKYFVNKLGKNGTKFKIGDKIKYFPA
ncbi:hypothetical protein K710_1674 [Streptococcus iniae SF1]|nr:hypothetical protein K710_1674 [Streptococcus iniae SF1]EKB51873.1 hypothetical protein A0G_1779 [Streptococcus iniae 9117]